MDIMPNVMAPKMAQNMGKKMMQETQEKGVQLDVWSCMPAAEGDYLLRQLRQMDEVSNDSGRSHEDISSY